jgi:hypothetical protein
LKAAENRPSHVAAVAVEGVQVADRAHGNQKYEVQQIVGESGLGYEVTAITKIWLPKASVGPKLLRKYRAEQRAVIRIRTRWSSRLQNRG